MGAAGFIGVAYAQQQRTIVRNVTVGGQPVGGLDSLTAIEEITADWEKFSAKGFTYTNGNQQLSIPVEADAVGDEVALDVALFDPALAVNEAYSYGHRGEWWQQAYERFSGALGRRHEFGTFILDIDTVDDLLRKKLADGEKPATNAGFTLGKNNVVTMTDSANGSSYDYHQMLQQTTARLRSLSTDPITFTPLTVQPTIISSAEQQAIADQEVPTMLDRAPFTLEYATKTWTIDRDQLGKLLGFVQRDGTTHVGFDTEKTTSYLNDVKKDIEVVPKDAKFSIVDGQVKEFQTSVVGVTVEVTKSLEALQTALVTDTEKVALVVSETKPLTDTVAPNTLGVTELVAEGKTNFHGSPTNRRFNLTLGAQKINGLLIKPGETFSLVDALGKIDGAHGWKPELVIKPGGVITPEFGGGLCQVATTLFRAALNTGLPIVERRNHSLRISYYEPPVGLDATIYEPKPDLRFTNDYAGYLLIQTHVVGDELIFQFYGTKDGRKVDIPEPKVYNKVGLPATKTIEVTDLKPGEKVCQTPGHPGADATATYTVTKSDGTAVTQVFQSHYKAIGVICRVGKAKASAKTN